MPIDGLMIKLLFPKDTSQPDELQRVLSGLEAEPLAAPTHANQDERKRLPYDRDAMVSGASGRKYADVKLWRAKPPKFSDGLLTAARQNYNTLRLDYGPLSKEAQVAALFETWTRLSQQLEVEFGFIHNWFKLGTPESQLYNLGIRVSFGFMQQLGLCGIHPRTFFGRDLTGFIGRERLLSLNFSKPTSWGGVQLDLVADPWAADFETLARRQREVLDIFRGWGFVGDYRPVVDTDKLPGPSWTPRLWFAK